MLYHTDKLFFPNPALLTLNYNTPHPSEYIRLVGDQIRPHTSSQHPMKHPSPLQHRGWAVSSWSQSGDMAPNWLLSGIVKKNMDFLTHMEIRVDVCVVKKI
jgi:hypothetical protein